MAAKSGRSLGDIFSSTSPVSKAAQKKIAEVRKEIEGGPEVLKVTMFLTQDQLDYLDDQTREIRRNTKATMKRTTILRGILDGMRLESVNLGKYGSEEDLAEAVRKRMPLKGGFL